MSRIKVVNGSKKYEALTIWYGALTMAALTMVTSSYTCTVASLHTQGMCIRWQEKNILDLLYHHFLTVNGLSILAIQMWMVLTSFWVVKIFKEDQYVREWWYQPRGPWANCTIVFALSFFTAKIHTRIHTFGCIQSCNSGHTATKQLIHDATSMFSLTPPPAHTNTQNTFCTIRRYSVDDFLIWNDESFLADWNFLPVHLLFAFTWPKQAALKDVFRLAGGKCWRPAPPIDFGSCWHKTYSWNPK